MAEKTEFKSVVNYGIEAILANVSLLIFSVLIGGSLTLLTIIRFESWITTPRLPILFVSLTALTYMLFLPSLIYKVIADGVAKGHELTNQTEK